MTAAAGKFLLAVSFFGLVLSNIPAQAQTDRSIAVTGTVAEGGVPCQAVQGDDGVLYTVRRTMAVRAFRPGDRVRIEGRIAEVSICQQGRTIDFTLIEKVSP